MSRNNLINESFPLVQIHACSYTCSYKYPGQCGHLLALHHQQTPVWLLHRKIQYSSSSSSGNFIPNRKQSTAYMSKDTSVNQYTLMFCWWSPEKPKAYLAGNQKSVRERLSVDAADQIHGFMNPREWPAQPSSWDRLHQRARQPPAVRTNPLEHNSLQVRTHDRQPGQSPTPAEGPQRAPPNIHAFSPNIPYFLTWMTIAHDIKSTGIPTGYHIHFELSEWVIKFNSLLGTAYIRSI